MDDYRPYQLPKARHDQLIVKQLPDEVLVYDLRRDEAHCLNQTAALVWKYCDGNSGVSEIADALSTETQTLVDERVVLLALDQLEKFDLLEPASAAQNLLSGISRRQLVRQLGVAALALPVIISISAPTAQAQGSCPTSGSGRPPGCPCSGGGNCTSGTCCPDPLPNTPCITAGRAPGTCL